MPNNYNEQILHCHIRFSRVSADAGWCAYWASAHAAFPFLMSIWDGNTSEPAWRSLPRVHITLTSPNRIHVASHWVKVALCNLFTVHCDQDKNDRGDQETNRSIDYLFHTIRNYQVDLLTEEQITMCGSKVKVLVTTGCEGTLKGLLLPY